MELNDSQKIMGIPEGIYYGQFDRTDELNGRFNERYFPEIGLQPNFDPRPVSTKYTHFTTVDRRAPVATPIQPHLDHTVELNFNPGSRRGPVSGFFNNVDQETILRNQSFALQRGADQGVFVPSSNSDLYKTTIVSRPGPQPHPKLFEQPQLEGREDDFSKYSRNPFFNVTRVKEPM